MTRILIVGGGYAGLYTAWTLERLLRRGEAKVTVLDPRPYMTYQPFLPEVASGAIEARHAVVPLRRHLRRTRVVAGAARRIDHAHRTVHAVGPDGQALTFPYDVVVVTAGAVTRTFPIPGLLDEAIGLKNVEEAVAIRDRLLTAFDRAAALPDGPERARLLTVTFVGGGFSGVEGFAETLSLATELLAYYPELRREELAFHLVEAQGRILPEVTERPGRWVVKHLRSRGGIVHLGAKLVSAVGGHVELSTGEEFDSELIVWTAGNAANPVVAKHTDLPVDTRGYLLTRPDLRLGSVDEPVPDAWAAGDDAAIPDLALGGASFTVPNAQHAVRQARLLAANVVATLRGLPTRDYEHPSLGVVATLGRGHGIFQFKRLVITGWPAWALHRGYHVLAVPTWERKLRVLLDWLPALAGRRDPASLAAVSRPREAFRRGGTPPPERSDAPTSLVA
ncbi:NADH dehydrogenase [Beutenbergia cavernae DSM 12333]|uniref:NADH dehydrogenase n=1 Tax=Beutenbergia cavernae (strain ATCC BAA-8 / DSM 12333 / CCUG 43141 / JCM 11478 / NBRC 16432 / NCIMB 13614 / HKI 0122) TaxID=471853 RepID=C5C6I4_BEUC1|nr:FAD-dependent oxidoreductase [Beutenbergia cavernae]ACQ80390.1 NADH dehydrogenase [Beutenbergia cavernae DSM 12333]